LDNIDFTTTDTAIAAYLISEGFPYPTIKHTQPNECVFCFTKDDKNFDYEKYYRNYRLGIATGNIVLFFKAYKELLKQVHR
jgi:hypothetical protein